MFFGFGSRGVAIHNPSEKQDGFEPIPLYINREDVESVVAERERRGVHVIEYELVSEVIAIPRDELRFLHKLAEDPFSYSERMLKSAETKSHTSEQLEDEELRDQVVNRLDDLLRSVPVPAGCAGCEVEREGGDTCPTHRPETYEGNYEVTGPFSYYGTYWLARKPDGSYLINLDSGRPLFPTRPSAERAIEHAVYG